MLPKRKFGENLSGGGTGYPRWEVSWKLTIDLGPASNEFRQVRQMLQNADVACEDAGKIREG